MSSQGQWLGKWPGEWFGATSMAPGAMYALLSGAGSVIADLTSGTIVANIMASLYGVGDLTGVLADPNYGNPNAFVPMARHRACR